jgi:hypothetical protein
MIGKKPFPKISEGNIWFPKEHYRYKNEESEGFLHQAVHIVMISTEY